MRLCFGQTFVHVLDDNVIVISYDDNDNVLDDDAIVLLYENYINVLDDYVIVIW